MSKLLSIVVTRHPVDKIMQDFYVAINQLTEECQLDVDLIVVNTLVSDDCGVLDAKFNEDRVSLRFYNFDMAVGQTGSIMQGMKEARSEYILSIDPDMSASLFAANKMLSLILSGDSVVVAHRLSQGESRRGEWWRLASSYFFNVIISFIIGFRIYDFNSPMFMLSKSVINDLGKTALPLEAYKFKLYMNYRENFSEIQVPDSSGRYGVASTYRIVDLAALFLKRLWMGVLVRFGWY